MGQFLGAVSAREVVEAFSWSAPYQIPAQQGFDVLRHLVGGNRMGDFAAELSLGTAAAANHDVIALDLLFLAYVHLGGEQADIADIVLSAGIGAAGQVNIDRLVERQACIEMIDQRRAMALCVAEGEFAAQIPGARDHTAANS